MLDVNFKFEVYMEKQFRYLIYSILFFMWADIKTLIFSSVWSASFQIIGLFFLAMWAKEVWYKRNINSKLKKEMRDDWHKF